MGFKDDVEMHSAAIIARSRCWRCRVFFRQIRNAPSASPAKQSRQSGSVSGFPGAAVSMLGSHGGASAVPLLLEIARTNPDQKLRLTAIKRLGEQHTDQVTDELIKIYDADRTKEVRGQILRALVESRTPRGTAKVLEIARSGDDLARPAICDSFHRRAEDSASLDELIRIYDADKTKEIRSQILRALSERDDQRARTKLLEVARQGETPELRIEALFDVSAITVASRWTI
jgi:HEAT repeat protein